MNVQQLTKQVGLTFRLRPLPIRLDVDGAQLMPSDDAWRLEGVADRPTRVQLKNLSTGHFLELESDNVQERRSPDFLMLRCQLTISASGIDIEPIQKGSWVQPRDNYAHTIARLAYPIAETLIIGEELPHRRVVPWILGVRSGLRSAASFARSTGVEDVLVKSKDSALVLSFADAAQDAAEFQMPIGGWENFASKVSRAVTLAQELNIKLLDKIDLDPASLAKNFASVRAIGREAEQKASKIVQASRGGSLKTLQHELSTIGNNVLHKTYFPLHHLPTDLKARLIVAGRALHLFDSQRNFGPRVESVFDVQCQMQVAAREIVEVGELAERANN